MCSINVPVRDVCVHGASSFANLRLYSPSPAVLAMKTAPKLQPKRGDKILICKKGVIEMILNGKKTLEIRSRRFKAGRYFLGCSSCIHAVAQLGPAIRIDTFGDFERLRHSHMMIADALPYNPTWALPIERVEQLSIPYKHTRGAITIVRYRP